MCVIDRRREKEERGNDPLTKGEKIWEMGLWSSKKLQGGVRLGGEGGYLTPFKSASKGRGEIYCILLATTAPRVYSSKSSKYLMPFMAWLGQFCFLLLPREVEHENRQMFRDFFELLLIDAKLADSVPAVGKVVCKLPPPPLVKKVIMSYEKKVLSSREMRRSSLAGSKLSISFHPPPAFIIPCYIPHI